EHGRGHARRARGARDRRRPDRARGLPSRYRGPRERRRRVRARRRGARRHDRPPRARLDRLPRPGSPGAAERPRASADRRGGPAPGGGGARRAGRTADRHRGGDPHRGGVAFLRSHLGRDRAARGGHRPGHGGAGSVARGGRAPDGGPDDRRGAAPRGPRGDRQRRYARRAAQARGGGVADPRTVRLVLAAALAARAAWGASPCEEGRAQTGLALAAREGGLEIAAVDAGSAAAESGLHAGDTLVQVNAALPRSCADYARAVRDAREGKKALLLLVRRSTGTVPLALGPATWERAVATAPPPPPPEAPSVRALVATPAPAPVAPEAHASLDELEGERRPRHGPSSEGEPAPFFADSEAAATIEEFPFLRDAVSRDPRPGLIGESSGLWRPLQARALLWAHGREELERLTSWLGRAGR